MAVTHKKTVNFSGVAGGGQANYNWQDPSVNWITWPPTQVGATDEWEFVVASNSGAQRTATIEVRHWDYANDNSLTDSFTITQAAAPSVPTYTSLSGAPDPANEGQVVTFTVQGTDLSAGTVPYTLSGTGINASDINGGVLSGNITMANTTGNNWEGTLQVTLTNDQTQEGTENLICSLGATDSNGVATGGFTTNVQVNDTSTQPSTVSIELQWFESTATSGNWQVSGSSVSSGTVTNETSTAIASNFDAAPGEVIQFTITGTTNGTDFTSVGGADIITISSQSASGSLISENLINQDSISFVYQYTVPSANETKGVTFAAETLPDAGNNQIWVTSGVDNPSTNTTTGGTGQMAYTLNRSASAPQSFLVRVKLDPDGTLADSGQDPEVYFASDAAGTQTTVPWFASIASIDNAHTDADGANAEVTISEGVVSGGGTPSGFSGTPAPSGPTSPVSGSSEQFGGSSGASPMAGPSPGPGSNNQCYIIIKHPGDPANYASINYTGSSQVTTTQAPATPEYVFNFTTSNGTVNMIGNSTALLNFEWYDGDNTSTPGPTLNTSDFSFSGGAFCNGSINVVNQSGTTGTVQIETVGCNSGGYSQSTNVEFTRIYLEHADQASNSKVVAVTVNPCIVYGQPVTMADGSTKLIEEVVVGDVLKSAAITGLGAEEDAWKTWSTTGNDFAETAGTTTVTSVVQGSYASYYKFQFGAGQDELKTTHEHPLLTKRADNSVLFVRADEVVVGDSIYNGLDQTWKEVTAADMIPETVQVVSIDAEDNDNFFVNGLAVHNGPNQK